MYIIDLLLYYDLLMYGLFYIFTYNYIYDCIKDIYIERQNEFPVCGCTIFE